MGNDPLGTRGPDENPTCPIHETENNICGGPHRVVRTDLGDEVLAPSQEPIGSLEPAAAIPMVMPHSHFNSAFARGVLPVPDGAAADHSRPNPLIPASQAEIDQRDEAIRANLIAQVYPRNSAE